MGQLQPCSSPCVPLCGPTHTGPVVSNCLEAEALSACRVPASHRYDTIAKQGAIAVLLCMTGVHQAGERTQKEQGALIAVTSRGRKCAQAGFFLLLHLLQPTL